MSVFLFVVTAFASVANAADNIAESPDVKIVIEGEMGTYNDVTIIANGRTMLPLREVLTNLGVQNDDQHIIWNAAERSVTVKKEDKTIYLKVGKKAVNVNGVETAIDVAPIIYAKNSRTYIPARVVAESLGKQVVWDAQTRSVLIKDQSSFNEVKDILTKSNKAMENVGKYKLGMEMKMKISQDELSMDYGIDMNAEVDEANKAMHTTTVMNIFGADTKSETYLKDGCSYTKDETTGKWSKEEMSESDFEEMFSSTEMTNMEVSDVLCAGLVVAESKNPDEIVLRGDVLVSDFINGFNSGLGSSESDAVGDFGMGNFDMELTYDKNTYMCKSITLDLSGEIEDETGAGQFGIEANIVISDYNGAFVIELPQDAIVGDSDAIR